jgi:transcriptional regulator with XRE-family HTH domain
MDILGRLIEERKNRDISVSQIAKKVGVTVTAVRNWENGKSDIPLLSLMRYAKAVKGRIIFLSEDLLEELYY